VATVLGLRGWPAAAEERRSRADLAILADVVRDVPGARLHLTHVSTRAPGPRARAKAAGLPVTCDVTPHHLALTDEWLAGARRWSWDASGDPWADDAIAPARTTALRVNPPLRPAEDAAACLARPADGTADAIATDHAPHTEVDKAVEFGPAANGISGLETALGVVLAAVDAGTCRSLARIEALTTGRRRCSRAAPARTARSGWSRGTGGPGRVRSLGELDRDTGRPRIARQEHAAARP
jgi:dihydroorotase